MTKNKLYLITLIACSLGLLYLFYTINYSESCSINVCITKKITSLPCPSCGTTRAVELLLQGKLAASFLLNPFGIIVAAIMIIAPFWIAFDVLFKKETFFTNYKKFEIIIRKKPLAIILILLVILNWIWNINKGL